MSDRCPYGRTRPDGTCLDGTPGCRCADEAVDASIGRSAPAEALDFEAAERKAQVAKAAVNEREAVGTVTAPKLFRDHLNTQHRAALARLREEYQGRIKELEDTLAASKTLLAVKNAGCKCHYRYINLEVR